MVKSTITKISVSSETSEPINIEVVDEGAGAFIILSQDSGEVRINPEELKAVFSAARRLLKAFD